MNGWTEMFPRTPLKNGLLDEKPVLPIWVDKQGWTFSENVPGNAEQTPTEGCTSSCVLHEMSRENTGRISVNNGREGFENQNVNKIYRFLFYFVLLMGICYVLYYNSKYCKK